MIEIVNDVVEKAILVAVRLGRENKFVVEEHLEELQMLAETAGAETIIKMIQDRARLDSAFFIGKGKAEELKELVDLNDVTLVIFDEDLTPTQVRNLEKLIEKKILDRSGLILDIFASHAKTKQAKTQVELAQLQYMLPRLTRAWTHLSKQFGGIGTKGPGETQIETDRRIIRTRISKLKDNLSKMEAQNITKSVKRKEYLNATLVGYTNAGKSTLINLLTDSDLLAENKLFATLDSTTRSLELEKNKKIMISDTVGFIRKLPHNLIESFKSTLHVVADADLILHVIDISHPFFEDHIKVVLETLKELKCDQKTQLMIFNKVDALDDKSRIDYVLNKYDNGIVISAQRGINITALNEKLIDVFEKNFGERILELDINESKLVAQIHSLADVLSTVYDEDKIIIKFRSDKIAENKINQLLMNRKK
ncbi:MAG: GTPase HflX [Ignavibacteriae bacterium HGW-Ignavibacteriae-2]|nr:MAG: GTPase HflX [Ignavibacteriae bacterium HGW-Ignavibacteriae-2]